MNKRALFEVLILLSVAGCGASVQGSRMETPEEPEEDRVCGRSGTAANPLPPRCIDGRCPDSKECLYDRCLDEPPTCQPDAEGHDPCTGDSYCAEGRCIPYGLGPRCTQAPACTRPVVTGLFSPATKCRWSGSTSGAYPDHKNVLSTPLVIDFDFDDDPRTLHPSIVFNSYNCIDGGCGDLRGCYGVLRVIDGATCRDQFSLALPEGTPGLIGDTTPALGDIDGDGRPDIVAMRQKGGVAGWRYDPARKTFVEMWPMNYSSFNGGECQWDGLALHDLDDDGRPEILQATPSPAVYDQHGALTNGWSDSIYYERGLFPVVADVDGDGQVEMVTGAETFRWNARGRRWEMAWSSEGRLTRGHTALADFGRYGTEAAADVPGERDGVPEVVVIAAGSARIQTLLGRVLFGPLPLPKGGIGGPPTVADFDGDGHPEIGIAGARAYSVLDPDCQSDPGAVPKTGTGVEPCLSRRVDGVLWSQTSQDASSNVTGSSVFDFEGDGRAEVVYADECFARVYDGRTGRVLHSQPHTSCTWYENPLVADVDGDYKSEIVIPSNNNCKIICPPLDPVFEGVPCRDDGDCPGTTRCAARGPAGSIGLCRCRTDQDCGRPTLACANPIDGTTDLGKVCRTRHAQGTAQQGIEVLHDMLDRWVPSRTIWNQHSYSVTNVNDDGTIPRTSQWQPNWKVSGLNNFRTNTQGAQSHNEPLAVPDVTVRPRPAPSCSQKSGLRLEADVCNRGTAPIAAGVPVTFYRGEPAARRPACKTSTTVPLDPGACQAVGCDDRNPPRTPYDVTVSGDDSGGGKGNTTECNEDNNRAVMKDVLCRIIG